MRNTSENRRFRTVSLPIMTVYRFFEKISSFHDWDFKQGVEKRPSRFSFIRAEAFIPHPFGCNKRYESRLQFLMRTHSATFTARCVIGDARDFSALLGFASDKSEVEKRLQRFSFIGDARDFCAGNFALRARCKSRTARNL